MWHTHATEYYLALKKNELMLYTCNNMGKSQNDYTEFKKKKKPEKNECKHYDAAYIKLQENAN